MTTPLCQCGCGRKVNRYNETQKKRGVKKGDWARFIPGHNSRVYREGGWNGHRAEYWRTG